MTSDEEDTKMGGITLKMLVVGALACIADIVIARLFLPNAATHAQYDAVVAPTAVISMVVVYIVVFPDIAYDSLPQKVLLTAGLAAVEGFMVYWVSLGLLVALLGS